MPSTHEDVRGQGPDEHQGSPPAGHIQADFDDAVLRLATFVVAITISAGAQNNPPLSATQVRVLMVLDAAPQGVTLNQVAAAVSAAAPSASRLCRRLIAHGLTARTQGPGNTITLRLSAAGHQTLARVDDSRLQQLKALGVDLPAHRRTEVTATLHELAQAVPSSLPAAKMP